MPAPMAGRYSTRAGQGGVVTGSGVLSVLGGLLPQALGLMALCHPAWGAGARGSSVTIIL